MYCFYHESFDSPPVAHLHLLPSLTPSWLPASCPPPQVYAMTQSWPQAEAAYRRCVDTASEASSRGQALNCVGTALQSQGRPDKALPLYREAAQLWTNQPIVYFSIATAHKQLGQVEQALAALDEGLEMDARCQSGLQGLLLSLRQSLVKEQEAAGQQEGRQLPEAGVAV